MTITMTAGAVLANASDLQPSVAESFPVGTSGSACLAQSVTMGAARASVFDRKWVVLCSDAAKPVGTAYVLKNDTDAAARIASAREETLECSPTDAFGRASCRGAASGLEWRIYRRSTDRGLIVVEGLAGFDSALQLAFESIARDHVVPGNVTIANLGTQDALALAKARAAVTDADTLIGQGYRDNSAGSYAEAAEFFAAVPERMAEDQGGNEASRLSRLHEVTINRALQNSNLGAFEQARRLFDDADRMGASDAVQTRLARNYEAIDAINRGDLDKALEILARPVPPIFAPAATADGTVRIDTLTAAGLNSSGGTALSGILGQPTRLTPNERAAIVDAQAKQLRGTVLRLQGKPDAARSALVAAYNDAMRVRDGRVVSITRLRAQTLSEMALSYEAQGRTAEAEALLRRALSLVESQYPDSISVNAARARLAGFLSRHGATDEAIGIYRTVVADVTERRGTLVGMTNLMRPYFDLLATKSATDPAAIAALFQASQLIERPGAADTLAVLSRELEGGSDEAASLFRSSLAITRDLERTRIALARANAEMAAGGPDPGIAAMREQQDRLRGAQLQTVEALSAYPRYRAVAHRVVTLDDMRATLAPGEGYLKLANLAGSFYAVLVTPDTAKAWKVAMSAAEVSDAVTTLRDSISVTINGVQSTYPFDVDTAVKLDKALLDPATGEIATVRHLVFEPDGAMLRLPINLLTSDTKGVAAYHARVNAGGDEYDFTGIDWLGRDRAVSTALSAASFRDARKTPASQAKRSFLGLGQNAPLGPVTSVPGVRSGAEANIDAACDWPVSTWNQPVSDLELLKATSVFGASQSSLMIGAAFTDEAVEAREDLDQFRIVHFATHGLVTAPRVGCPVRPALLTSFGDAKSDGLLSFGEIFDLHLDADLVILSACDTAGGAGLAVTREAGLSSGGGQALDGLVRAFIAAGGRQVIASHWPAPDDFNATERLFNGFYHANGTSVGEALRTSEIALMDDPVTSHPYYWAGFAVIGDSARALTVR
ncbi:CHAT domain-containing protein [Novosphingobium mangrovi (ex Huang et al. 2023)]|uniref:CHAT domain-containing protein n=1 Tax=Novosphingobium mangrovi (ex Huang et al. 2023) TaxID=2976432 RepID=A0ABT2I9K1_9SPHN|nr:CHAT domain-containing protein [Novosphingobium mangrovi (ex Huang et al. 2023)]MCT2401498.1 CHAT domain-containing protein [Novosphingobium mangrovi (ex Huang et al. 2023)]